MRPDFFWMGGMWIFPVIMCGIMFIVIPIVLLCIFGRNGRMPFCRFQEDESPLDILKKRYAKGELSKEEFERMKRELSE